MNLLRSKNEIIFYTVNNNINNSLNISVENGEVVVKAPCYLSKNKIKEIVEQKKKWILDKIKEYEELTKYENCELVKILGKEYIVKITYKNVEMPQVNLEEKIVEMILPNKYKKMDKKDISKFLIEKMYNVVATNKIEQTMEKVRIATGYAPDDYKIEKMDNTLAYCSQNKIITINPEIVKYRMEIMEYIILHQFCHLKYKNHTKSFYQMLATYMPQYKEIEKEICNFKY